MGDVRAVHTQVEAARAQPSADGLGNIRAVHTQVEAARAVHNQVWTGWVACVQYTPK